MNFKDFVQSRIRFISQDLGFDESLGTLTFSQMKEIADLQSNIPLVLSKICKQPPMQLAEKYVQKLNEDDNLKCYFDITTSNPGFINFKFSDVGITKLANELYSEKERIGLKKNKVVKHIFYDYGGANVAKELHMGHLRSPIIGESLKRLNEFFGNKCVSDTHLGDWGLQMGLTIAELEESGFLNHYFVDADKYPKPQITLDLLNDTYPRASAKSKVDADFKKKADDYTLFLQQKKQPFYEIWQDIRNVSIRKIEQNYADLNVHFDLWAGESTASPYIEQTLEIFKNKKLLRESEGALVVDIARDGEHIPIPKKSPDEVQRYLNPMPPAVIQKYNGGELYITTDLATILQRVKDYPNIDEIVYVTDLRQAGHFEQVFRCARLAGLVSDNVKLTHIGFGTMNGKDGRPFKTRNGGMIKLDDVVKMLKDKASEKLTENKVEDTDNLALKIGVSALKFADLSNQVTKDYVLDIDKFLSFEGKTGPYLQYTATRIKSLLQKAHFDEKNKNFMVLKLNEEHEIIMNIIKLQDAMQNSLKENSMHYVCLALYNLCSSYSTFYNNIRILTEPDDVKKDSYLNLSYLTLCAIKVALDILAIEIPDKM